jgi:AbrB family looped-hinge helix DNA binding protein
MRTTIDSAGRVVVPKPLRQAIGLQAGSEVEIRATDGRIEMEPSPLEVRFERRSDLLVAVPVRPVRPIQPWNAPLRPRARGLDAPRGAMTGRALHLVRLERRPWDVRKPAPSSAVTRSRGPVVSVRRRGARPGASPNPDGHVARVDGTVRGRRIVLQHPIDVELVSRGQPIEHTHHVVPRTVGDVGGTDGAPRTRQP